MASRSGRVEIRGIAAPVAALIGVQLPPANSRLQQQGSRRLGEQLLCRWLPQKHLCHFEGGWSVSHQVGPCAIFAGLLNGQVFETERIDRKLQIRSFSIQTLKLNGFLVAVR